MCKVWLDDLRPMPDGYDFHAKTAWEAIDMLDTDKVTDISLDHDLGRLKKCGTGYDVACHIENRAYYGKPLPNWKLHTANPVGEENMRRCLESAERIYNETLEHENSIE